MEAYKHQDEKPFGSFEIRIVELFFLLLFHENQVQVEAK